MHMISKERSYEEWFDATFVEHYDAVYRYLDRRITNGAEDLTAEVFTVAWRKRHVVPEPPLPWLYGVAANIVKTQLRSRANAAKLTRKIHAQPATTAADPSSIVEDQMTGDGAMARLAQELKAKDLELLRLWAWEQLEPREIAEVLGIRAGTVRSRLSRIRQRAAKILAEPTQPSIAL